MPTYDYECEQCGHRFEESQAMSDPRVETCPECRGPVRRLIGAGAGIIVKVPEGCGDPPRGGDGSPSCGAARTCCGRGSPCEKRPCDG